MAVWKFNRGEWTEAYVFLRLLGDGRIYGASADLVKDPSTYIDILNIIRDEPDKITIFERFLSDNIEYVRISKDEEVIRIVTVPEISGYAKSLYDAIKQLEAARRTVEIPDVQKYLESLGLNTPKASLSDAAKTRYGAKTDIIITSRSPFDHVTSTEGFSIKSHLGSPATLFNCSQTSGFTYEIVGCDEKVMHELNARDTFLSIVKGIKEKGCKLVFYGCRNPFFEQNISIVDSQMHKILSEAVLTHAGYYSDTIQGCNVKDICNCVIGRNPIGVTNPQIFYPAKFKDFLFASFAGMTASTAWSGRKEVTGGYIDVGNEGEMLYYRAISDEVFGNYLFENTYFDRPDRGWCKDLALAKAKAFHEGRKLSNEEECALTFINGVAGVRKSKKGDFGYVYGKKGRFHIDINFQIRFR